MISVLALMLVLYDGEINTFEALFLLILYAIYILIMYYNDKIEKYTKSIGKIIYLFVAFYKFINL